MNFGERLCSEQEEPVSYHLHTAEVECGMSVVRTRCVKSQSLTLTLQLVFILIFLLNQVQQLAMATSLPRTLGELQLYRILQRANLLSYYDAFIQQGGDDVQQLCEAGEEEFLEIMALVGMASKPLHVRRLQKALRDWVTNPSVFNQPLNSLPVSSIPLYKISEGSAAYSGSTASSNERSNNLRDPVKFSKCLAALCGQGVGSTKPVLAGSSPLQMPNEPRFWQGQSATESEQSLSPADPSSPSSPRENGETLDAAAVAAVAESVERLIQGIPKTDQNEVKEFLRTNKKLAKMISHIFDMNDGDPHKEEEIRKYSAIYGRFDSKRKDGKQLTLHEVQDFPFCLVLHFVLFITLLHFAVEMLKPKISFI